MARAASAGIQESGYANRSGGGSPLRSIYDAAATTQAEDYDKIMGGYDAILNDARNRGGQNKLNYVPLSPQFQKYTPANYSRTGELQTALTGLEDFSRTGGYSDADIGNIRERGLSPLRSVYANAQDALRRRQALSGGNLANYGASTAKMARELGYQLADQSTNINAKIAEMVQSGKLSGLNLLSSTAGSENALRANIESQNAAGANNASANNANIANQINEINARMPLEYGRYNQGIDESSTNDELAALSGKTNLYGTTPALTNTFANQVLANNAQNLQAATTANQIKAQRANIGLNLMGTALGSPASTTSGSRPIATPTASTISTPSSSLNYGVNKPPTYSFGKPPVTKFGMR